MSSNIRRSLRNAPLGLVELALCEPGSGRALLCPHQVSSHLVCLCTESICDGGEHASLMVVVLVRPSNVCLNSMTTSVSMKCQIPLWLSRAEPHAKTVFNDGQAAT